MENGQILINTLFAGSYLSEQKNIGHEFINLFRDDNGDNYLYITPGGTVDDKKYSVKSVLFARHVEGKTTVEILAKAEELATVDISPDDIKYAGASLKQIFEDNIYHGKVDPGVYCTYKANKIHLPKNGTRIIVTIDDGFKTDDANVRLIRLHSNVKAINPQTGRKYFFQEEDPRAYSELQELLDNDIYWEPKNTTEKIISDDSTRKITPTFLEIIRKEDDELVFSNLLAYYFQYNRSVFQKFAKEVLGVSDFAPRFELVRESNNNIDLWIEDDRHVLVVENKIKSGLNGLKDDNYSQLNKYQEYTEERTSNPEDDLYQKESYYYIFTPDYNQIDASKYKLEKPYKTINYSTIYDFFYNNAVSFMDEKFFSDFLKGLKNHTMSVSELNFNIMRSRLLEKINRA
jgi:hypothetical protein